MKSITPVEITNINAEYRTLRFMKFTMKHRDAVSDVRE